MRILYIALSCSPYHGSEDAIGWNIPVESSRENMVYVITREEQRAYIEDYAKQNELKNIRFFYVDIPGIYKKLFTGPFYSGRLNILHKRAEKLAEELCRKEQIELIHQITPIEFRSIGNYGKIPNVKFVCGPIAGGQSIPGSLMSYMGSHRIIEWIRTGINWLYRQFYRATKKFSHCQFVLFANNETRTYLADMVGAESDQPAWTEVGIKNGELSTKTWENEDADHICRFLVAGRLVCLKGHRFLFDALKRVPAELKYQCRIVGDGSECERLKKKCATYGLDHVVTFAGAVPYSSMEEEYRNADILILPSFREATGTVILEAMAKELPVITINKFGAATFVNNDCGWLYDGDSKEEYIENLKNAVVDCIKHPDEVKRRGENARNAATDCTWEKKHAYYQHIYQRVLGM